MIFTPTQFHFIASFISGILLILVGIAVLSRNKESEINQSFFAFFILMSIYELLTALQLFYSMVLKYSFLAEVRLIFLQDH